MTEAVRTGAAGPATGRDEVVVVTTAGSGSMDRYGRQLAARLPVAAAQVEPDFAFGVPTLSLAAARATRRDVVTLRRLRGLGGSLLHLTNHHLARYGPLLRRPYVLTAHDLIRWLDLTADPPLISRPGLRDRALVRRDAAGIAAATALIAPSGATADDLVRHLGIPPDRVHVVPEGLDHAVFHPVGRRLLADPYLLVVGSEHPRKNLAAVVRAFALLKRDPGLDRLRLVKVGADGDGVEARFRDGTDAVVRALGLEREIVRTGEVGRDDLVGWYSGAVALVMPSLYEGFGFPPLEAMACGTPAVVSTAGSLPEITGGAALTVAPHDVDGLAAAVRRLLLDRGLRRRLVAAGLARAAEFSWERAARETMDVYAAVLGPPR